MDNVELNFHKWQKGWVLCWSPQSLPLSHWWCLYSGSSLISKLFEFYLLLSKKKKKKPNIIWNIRWIQHTIVLPSGLISSNYFHFQVLLNQTHCSNLYVKHSSITKTSIVLEAQVKLKRTPLLTQRFYGCYSPICRRLVKDENSLQKLQIIEQLVTHTQ